MNTKFKHEVPGFRWDFYIEDNISLSTCEGDFIVDLPVIIGWQLDCENEVEWDVIMKTNGQWEEVPGEILPGFEIIVNQAVENYSKDFADAHEILEDSPDDGLVCGHCGFYNWKLKC